MSVANRFRLDFRAGTRLNGAMHLALCFFCCVLAILIVQTVEAQAAGVFMAGAAVADISPWMGVSINGDFLDHPGTNLHDPLQARALVLDDGTTRLAIVVADNCLIKRETFDRPRRSSLDAPAWPPGTFSCRPRTAIPADRSRECSRPSRTRNTSISWGFGWRMRCSKR